MGHDGEPLRGAERQKQQIAAADSGTPGQGRARAIVLPGNSGRLDFKILGEETLPTGPAWVIEARPRPGFQPRSRYAQVFPKMRGKLWIDKKDIQWVKADAMALGGQSQCANIFLEPQF